MATEVFVLIPGRSSEQGSGISEGKFNETYQRATTVLKVFQDDMQRLQLSDGDRVMVTSAFGSVEIEVTASKGDELVSGLLFIGYGDLSSRLMGADTHGTGMPTSKCIDVTLEKV